MSPRKKDKKKGKKKKEEKPPKITKTQYLNQIAENNAILAQARREIEQVENVYFSTEKKFKQTQEDMADIIQYLQHEIQENEEEIATFDEKIISYKAEIDKNDKYYESIFSKLESEYEEINHHWSIHSNISKIMLSVELKMCLHFDGDAMEKNMQLQHQIQLTSAKLFATEETRKQRDAYLKQKEIFYQKLQLMKCRHEEEIYIAEKSAIIKQDTLQKNMGLHLATLASDFRQATDIAIGETTNKLINDNITLGNTMTCMQEIIKKERDSYLKAHTAEKKYKHNAELLNDEYFYILRKFERRIQKIESLLKSHEELTDRITASQRLFKDNRRLQRKIMEKECLLREKTQESNDRQRVLEENEETFDSIKESFNAIRNTMLKLELSLFEAAKKAKEGIDVENVTRLEEKDDDAHVEIDKEEQEENLKEFKFKIRSNAFEEIFEKLSSALLQDAEMQLIAPSSDSYLTSYHESVSSDANR